MWRGFLRRMIYNVLLSEVADAHIVELLHAYEKALPPTKSFWVGTLRFIRIILDFMRGVKEGDWLLKLRCVADFGPLFAVYDKPRYFLWGLPFQHDMVALDKEHPAVHRAFLRGESVVNLTGSPSGGVPIDQLSG